MTDAILNGIELWPAGHRAVIRGRLFILSWFLCALGLSASGWFERFSVPALFGIGALVTLAGFAILYKLEARFRRTERTRTLRRLTYGQVYRFFGLLAFVKAYQHVLPALFAVPTGLMDAAIAGTSFYVANNYAPAHGRVSAGFFVWNYVGVATLAVSNVLAFMTSSAAFGATHGGVTSQALAAFPMSLVPTFIGPLVLVFHLLAICDGHRQTSLA